METSTAVPAVVPLTRGLDFTLSELVDSYMACYLGRDRQIAQRIAYFIDAPLPAGARWATLGSKPAAEIDSDDVADALDALQRRGVLHNAGGRRLGGNIVATGKPLAAATINRYRTTLQAILSWGRKKRLMPKGWTNPVNDTERLPEDNMRTRYLSEAEYDRLLKAARVSYWKKLTLLVKLAVTTGARRGTLLALRWKDIDLKEGRATCPRTKNGEPFVLVLLPDVVAELKRFQTGSNPEDLIFCGRRGDKPINFEKAYYNALANAGIEGACFHTLRHSHASWLARRGAPLLAIADSLGHKSLAMTKRYSHLCVDSRAEMLSRMFAQNGGA